MGCSVISECDQRAQRLLRQIDLTAVPHDDRIERDVVGRQRAAKQRDARGSGIVGESNVCREIDEYAERGVRQHAIGPAPAPPSLSIARRGVQRVFGEARLYLLQRDVASAQTVAGDARAAVSPELAMREEAPSRGLLRPRFSAP